MKRVLFVAVVALMASAGTASAGEGVAVGLKVSTLGLGLEATVPVNDYFNVRMQGNGFVYNRSQSEVSINYDAKLRLFTLGGIVDYHPFAGVFRISAGAYYNGNRLDLNATPTSGSFTINNTNFTAAQVGSMNGRVDFNSFSPYVGIGLGNAVSEGSNWGFNVEAGALYQGAPTVSLTASGTAPGLQAAVASEQQALQNTINRPLFRWYPVAAIGLSYRF